MMDYDRVGDLLSRDQTRLYPEINMEPSRRSTGYCTGKNVCHLSVSKLYIFSLMVLVQRLASICIRRGASESERSITHDKVLELLILSQGSTTPVSFPGTV